MWQMSYVAGAPLQGAFCRRSCPGVLPPVDPPVTERGRLHRPPCRTPSGMPAKRDASRRMKKLRHPAWTSVSGMTCTFPVIILALPRRDRRSRVRHIQTDEMELVSNEQVRDSSYSEMWCQEVFDLLAPAMPGYIPSQIIERIGYITSHNHETKCPNWVAWESTSAHTEGPYARKGVPYYSNDGSVEGIGYVTPETCKNECQMPSLKLYYAMKDCRRR